MLVIPSDKTSGQLSDEKSAKPLAVFSFALIVALVIAVQPDNASASHDSILDGNETDVIELHDENIIDPISFIESGNVKLSINVPLNALDMIFNIDGMSSNVIEYSIEHPLNADSLIVFIVLGITISINSSQSLNNSGPISSTTASETTDQTIQYSTTKYSSSPR